MIVGLVVIGGVLSGSGTGSGSGSQLWWGSKDSTDLKLGWTVRWRTTTGNKSCPI